MTAYRGEVTVVRRLHAAARRHPHAEVATAGVVFVVTLLTTAAGPNGGDIDSFAVATAAIASGILIVSRRYPLAVLLVSTAAAEAYLVHYEGHHGEMVLLAPLIALYIVADTSSRWRSLVIGCLAVLTFAGLHLMVRPASPLGAENVALAALGGLAVAAGEASRNRRAYQAEVERRALHAEADREAEAARRVTEERLRIARDLHDVVGHQLALIHVQAGVAAHRLGDPQGPAAEALAHIRSASKAALTELSGTVGLLRQPGEPPAPTQPIAGLAGLGDLLATFRRSGLTINDEVEGPTRPLPPAVDLTAYRVIQESLTNTCKHSGPTADVTLLLSYQPESLRILIHNGPYAGSIGTAGTGHGITGMRERVAALGGQVHAGPTLRGGFRVEADIPVPAGTTA
jgi:signal transduction histidine kinase